MADQANGNGNGAKIEAIAKNVLLTAVSRIMMTVGMTAVLGISGWAGTALRTLNASIAGHTATLAAIQQRLDRIEGSSGATAAATDAMRADIADLKVSDKERGVDIAAIHEQLITLRRNVQTVTCRVLPGKCGAEP
ncbi:MAG TPA: hypothetical protein VKB42_22570 [Dongiaceae bacterium]|nr:hypothetical protein [Dongiaceae bacterium]